MAECVMLRCKIGRKKVFTIEVCSPCKISSHYDNVKLVFKTGF